MAHPMPADATWSDYLDAHGGREASGWWVTLLWYGESPDPRPEAVGPYESFAQAVAAMEDSPLIEEFATERRRGETLEDVYVETDPTSVAQTLAEFGNRVTLIDPGEPSHFGRPESERPETPRAIPPGDARSSLLQGAALRAPDSAERVTDRDTANSETRSPGAAGR